MNQKILALKPSFVRYFQYYYSFINKDMHMKKKEKIIIHVVCFRQLMTQWVFFFFFFFLSQSSGYYITSSEHKSNQK